MNKVRNGRSSSLRRRLAIVVLGGLLLGGCGAPEVEDEPDVGAREQAVQTVNAGWRVRFTSMRINDCPEWGTCEWWLYCKQPWQSYGYPTVAGAAGDTGDLITINRAMSGLGPPPYRIMCALYEYDGGFDSGFELVAETGMGPSARGSYSMRMRNGEGDVTLRFSIE